MKWEHEIDKHLGTADIVLLLVSADFLASKYCYRDEMTRALQRHEEGTARVVPIILQPVDWKTAPFSKLQALPTEAKPVTSWSNPDDAYTDIKIAGPLLSSQLIRGRSLPESRTLSSGHTNSLNNTLYIGNTPSNNSMNCIRKCPAPALSIAH